MVWGMLMPNGLIAVKILVGKQNAAKYITTIKSFCVPIMNLNVQPKIYLVQDNCSIHVAKQSKEFFKNQQFERIDWPSKSPDINLMENIWKMLSDLIYSNSQPKNLKNLKERLFEAVDQINSERRDISRNLYHTFKERLTKILITKGHLYN